MIRNPRTRAFTLMEIVYLLPIIAAALAVTYQMTARSVRMQERMMADVAGDARRADLLRRMGEDAERARTASLERSDGAVVLTFQDYPPPSTQPDEEREGDSAAAAATTVHYRILAGEVTRTEQSSDASSETYTWSLQPGDMDLAIEQINDQPRLVWISFIKQQHRDEGPELTQKLTTAVRIGPGGEQ